MNLSFLNWTRGAAPPDPPHPGVYHFLRQQGGRKVRLHLRIEPDGHGVLLVNASRIYHFNPTAAYMAYLCLNQAAAEDAVRALTRRFDAPSDQVRQDYTAFCEQIERLTTVDDSCPVCELELDTTAPFSDRPSAPYRMDLALTYRCNNDCHHCYNLKPRARRELDTSQWIEALDRLWDIGIPHIVFTGGEPTLRPDLLQLIAHAEHNGQITGLNTNGRQLKDPTFVAALCAAGLDHVQITLESHDPHIHDRMVGRQVTCEETVAGIRNALANPLFVMTNTTMLKDNQHTLSATLDFLAELGVPTVGLNALIYSGSGLKVGSGLPESSLPELLELARDKTSENQQRLIWYTPTQYCHFDPIQLGLGVKGCTAALYNMCVEPDGSVIPCQSFYHSLGSLLRDPWENIWEHELAVRLRERQDVPAACTACDLLQECGGGCPLARQVCETALPLPVQTLPVGRLEK
ncbi:MAG: PqqD family peptide modification chaperone [Anaerolineaceae bacterium]|nr:PqqD family peptide modification chaperone [Anaerolineaceae bacterium]